MDRVGGAEASSPVGRAGEGRAAGVVTGGHRSERVGDGAVRLVASVRSDFRRVPYFRSVCV